MGLPLPLATCLSWVGPPSNLGGGECARCVPSSQSVIPAETQSRIGSSEAPAGRSGWIYRPRFLNLDFADRRPDSGEEIPSRARGFIF